MPHLVGGGGGGHTYLLFSVSSIMLLLLQSSHLGINVSPYNRLFEPIKVISSILFVGKNWDLSIMFTIP